MADAGAAVVIADGELTGARLARQVAELLADRAALAAMAAASRGARAARTRRARSRASCCEAARADERRGAPVGRAGGCTSSASAARA